ncbi:hypothetical protein B0H21DRAFT_513589 [Amylocystis lapponica]|nr:hypothetical protein B0H21DRAFT_513589 [Amylocystis lapponica]
MLPTLFSYVLLLGWLTVGPCLGNQQVIFGTVSSPNESPAESVYKLKWPVNKVAIVGAGPGGMLAYREFTKAGFQVHMFERDDVPGGNWHYTEETPVDAPIPNADVSVGDYTPSRPPAGVQLPYTEEYHGSVAEHRRQHRGPKPVWETLHSSAPAVMQQFTELPWPVGTHWATTHYEMRNYMRAFASFHGMNSNDNNPNASYNTRVESIEKRYDEHGKEHGWRVLLKELVQTGPDTTRATWYEEDFDAVAVATGHFNVPNIPAIPGLPELAQRFPDRLSHARQYRHPEPFENETVLIVGAAVTGAEISQELNPWARKIYQSVRPDNESLPHYFLKTFLRILPENTTVVPEIKSFRPPSPDADFPGTEIELVNGTVITGVDRIIFATGFRYSFPFLPQYHSSSILRDHGVHPLVTDGTHVRSLHLDLFYIEEPTLGFINMNSGVQPFTYGEYLSAALAKVWAEKAFLPSAEEMWRTYAERVEDRGGYGRYLQFLGPKRADVNIRYFMSWLNTAAMKYGGRLLDSLPDYTDQAVYWYRGRYGIIPANVKEDQTNSSVWSALGLDPFSLDTAVEDESEEMYHVMFSGQW